MLSLLPSLCLPALPPLPLVGTDALQLQAAVLQADWQQQDEKGEADGDADPGLVIVHQRVAVVAVVGVPGPVHHQHSQ